jgi:ribonuclease Z
MISVTFLGVGAALPAPGRTNSCYLIEAGDCCILFDCGPAVLQQLASIGRTPGDVTHLFVSHGHGDHALGYPMFLLWWSLMRRLQPLPAPTVVASTVTWSHLDALWKHSYGELSCFAVGRVELPVNRHHHHALTSAIGLDTWPMEHSTLAPVLSARFLIDGKVLAFTADTALCDNIQPLARNADLLVHDSNDAVTVVPQRTVPGQFHSAACEAGEQAAHAGARNLALVHIGAEYEGNHAGLVAEARTRFSGHVFAPAPGEVFRL